jgi:hypothetical protein
LGLEELAELEELDEPELGLLAEELPLALCGCAPETLLFGELTGAFLLTAAVG